MTIFNKFKNECEKGFIERDTLVEINQQYPNNNLMWEFGIRFSCEYGHLNLVEFMIANGAHNFKEGVYCIFNRMRFQNLQRVNEYCKIADLMLSYSDDNISIRKESTISYKKYKHDKLLKYTKLHTYLALMIVNNYVWK